VALQLTATATVLPSDRLPRAEKARLSPTLRDTEEGVISTPVSVTEFVTVAGAEPTVLSTVARIAAVPALTAVTRPLLLTVATAVLLLLQATARPSNGCPAASRGTAMACVVAPTSIEGARSDTDTEETGEALTVSVACALFPSLSAMIQADPAARAVTTPLPFTVAMPVLEEEN
jgi:hypothetical protein